MITLLIRNLTPNSQTGRPVSQDGLCGMCGRRCERCTGVLSVLFGQCFVFIHLLSEVGHCA